MPGKLFAVIIVVCDKEQKKASAVIWWHKNFPGQDVFTFLMK